MLELYHWEPTFLSGEVLIALAEKHLPFESRYLDLLELEQHEPEFLRLNPSGGVPVLVHDGRVITECGLILEYLEDAFPQPSLRPEPLVAQYQTRFWLKYVAERMAPYVSLLGWRHLARPVLAGASVERAKHTIERLPRERRDLWRKALEERCPGEEIALARESLSFAALKLEETLGGAPWLAGNSYSLADIALAPTVRAMRVVVPDMMSPLQSPRTLAWLGRIEARPAVREALARARAAAPERQFAPGPEPPRWG
ncbi:MAG TPA: glutathione S-transferase family protein [Steroidobacteraceae bacterium]|nr:glutathione S-transferase family protein [Steroidobacteraceae bacterium]